MLYEPSPGRIRPFQENDTEYMFRFFCDTDMTIPREQSLPKSAPDPRNPPNPRYVCSSCGDRSSVEMDDDGPYLRVLNRPNGQLAAKEASGRRSERRDPG